MNGWARLCADCWYHFNPSQYLPEVPVADFDQCEECGSVEALFGLRVNIIEAAKDTEAMETIDITPTTEGFASIATLFVQDVVQHDVKASRTDAARDKLAEALKIAFMLGEQGRSDLMGPIVKGLVR